MATLIEKIGKQALQTFSNKNSMTLQVFKENFEKLKVLTDQLTAADVNLKIDNVKRKENDPPVTYISVYEDTFVTISIFMLKPGEKLPLHDHPQMYGILKVISGTVKIQSYTVVRSMNMSLTGKLLSLIGDKYPDKINARKLPEVVANEHSSVCCLTPEDRNLHEIQSIDGPAAFFDILSPPYGPSDEGERTCHYFKEVHLNGEEESGITTLITIPSPPEYWNDTAQYKGPRIRPGSGKIENQS